MGISRAGARTALTAALLTGAIRLVFTTEPSTLRREAGSVVGIVSTKESALPPLRITIDPAVCGPSLANESISVDGSGRLANVVVAVAGVKAQPPAEVVITNDRCRFVPRVAILKPRGTVKMTSKDPVLHTMHAAGADARALFNLSLPMPNITLSRPIDKPGVVSLSCSLHTWMRGYLHVTDELTAVSGVDGKFRIDDVPAGTHELRVWHEMLKVLAPVRVTVKDGETATVEMTLGK